MVESFRTSPPGPSATLPVGAQLGHYRIESLVARGGTAVVYEAVDVRLDRQVALKVLTPEPGRSTAADAGPASRFVEESRAAASLDHPNVVPVYEAGEVDGLAFIAMRYVSGGDLASRLRQEGRLHPARGVAVLAAVASALDAAHAAGLVHRDVKPGNVLLAPSGSTGGRDHVYLSDFGISRRAAASARATADGTFLGTLAYIAPEQIRGLQGDARSDVYALACTAYEVLTGVPPFVRDDQAALLHAHLSEVPALLSSHRSELAPADAVLAKGLAKDPDDRYQRAGDLLADLAQALVPASVAATSAGRVVRGAGGATVARPLPVMAPSPPGRRWWPRWRVPAAVAGLAATLVVGLLVVPGEAERVPPSPVSLPFALERYDGGVEVSRTWTLSGDGDRLHAELVLVGGSPGATFDEVVPKSLATSAAQVDADPAPLEVVREDPVLRFAAPTTPDAQLEVTYDIDVLPGPATLERLQGWAADQGRERAEYLASVSAPPPVTTASLVVRPDRVTVTAGAAPRRLELTGTNTDGGPAAPDELARAVWSSTDPDVAEVDGSGVVTATSPGAVSVTARLGAAVAEAVVLVRDPEVPQHEQSFPLPDGRVVTTGPAGAPLVAPAPAPPPGAPREPGSSVRLGVEPTPPARGEPAPGSTLTTDAPTAEPAPEGPSSPALPPDPPVEAPPPDPPVEAPPPDPPVEAPPPDPAVEAPPPDPAVDDLPPDPGTGAADAAAVEPVESALP